MVSVGACSTRSYSRDAAFDRRWHQEYNSYKTLELHATKLRRANSTQPRTPERSHAPTQVSMYIVDVEHIWRSFEIALSCYA